MIEEWGKLKLPDNLSKRLEIYTIDELCDQGCPVCSRILVQEGSGWFVSLFCIDHGIIWLFVLDCIHDRYRSSSMDMASKVWKNYVTGETSKEWSQKYG